MAVPKSLDWEKIKRGFIIQMDDGRYVSSILANGNPEKPVVYFTEYAREAKAWKSIRGVIIARNRIRETVGGCKAMGFAYDEVLRARCIGQEVD